MKTEDLIKLHSCEQRILDEFVSICNKYHLKYYLIAGTLLGAVRHGGFIPWDDDLDVAMPRKDYSKFLQIAKTELDKAFFLQCSYNDKEWNRIFSKIRMNNTLFVEKGYESSTRHNGIFIDIFPLDMGKKHGKISSKLLNKYVKMVKAHIRMATGEIPMSLPHKLISVLPLNFYIYLRNRWFKKNGKYYINYGSNYGIIKQTMPIDWYEPAKTIKFEHKKYTVPGKYKQVLSQLYGKNFMKLPPMDKRVTHNPVILKFDSKRDNDN